MSNDKANPREDEQRKHEEASLVRGAPVDGRTERRSPQDTEGVAPGRRPATAERQGAAPSIDEVAQRSDFARWFRPSELPTSAGALARTAASEGAPDWVLDTVRRLDPDRRFSTIAEVWDAAARA
jgi:hypothetical protein